MIMPRMTLEELPTWLDIRVLLRLCPQNPGRRFSARVGRSAAVMLPAAWLPDFHCGTTCSRPGSSPPSAHRIDNMKD